MPEPGTFIADSDFVNFVQPSPNIGERKNGSHIPYIVLHYTGMESADKALSWLVDERSQVSAHYFIFEGGEISQLVREKDRAWHAGQSSWKGETDINSRSIGIEIANPGHEFGYINFPARQMEAVVKLVRDIVARHKISPINILAHSDIAPLRKEDPGELFDWEMLYRAGIGVWVEPVQIREGPVLQSGDNSQAVLDFQNQLASLGFNIDCHGNFDVLTQACTTAFQRRYRQKKIDGIADLSTVETLRMLLAKL